MNELVLNKEKTYQTFESFGVSGAWWAQVNGGWTENDEESAMPKYKRISQLLFDKDKGIGVNLYRYNLGGGSMLSRKGKFSNECRRAESFDISDSEYDFSRDENAVRIMKQAVDDGVQEVILFCNTPPERITKNGKSHLDFPMQTNLAVKNYRKFATYVLDCAEHFIKEGIPVKYISPVNEPVWTWTGGQEGCHYRPHQVYGLFKVFCEELDKRPSLKGVKLSGAENGDIRWFNKSYCHVLLDNKYIRSHIDAVDTHSYCVTPPIPVIKNIIGDRMPYLKRYRRFMDRHYPAVNVKTSEWCHMQGGRDYGINSALQQAKVMMEDITVLNVTSWQLWIAVSNVDYCDGLIYSNDEERTFELTKRYYAFGNFSKFIEYGSVRFDADAGAGLKAAGFTKDGRSVVIVINEYDVSRELKLPVKAKEVYVTSAVKNLEETEADTEISIPSKSITTVIL